MHYLYIDDYKYNLSTVEMHEHSFSMLLSCKCLLGVLVT